MARLAPTGMGTAPRAHETSKNARQHAGPGGTSTTDAHVGRKLTC